MNSNSCGRGLVVFSLTLIFGLLIADQFVQSEEVVAESISVVSETKITLAKENGNVEKKWKCVREYERLNLFERSKDMSANRKEYMDLVANRSRLQMELQAIESKRERRRIRNEINEIQERLSKFEKIETPKNYGFGLETRNERLLYTEKCYEQEF